MFEPFHEATVCLGRPHLLADDDPLQTTVSSQPERHHPARDRRTEHAG
jgi:hypothetical protein